MNLYQVNPVKFGRDKSLSSDTCKVKSSKVIFCLVSPGKFDRNDFSLVIPVKRGLVKRFFV